MAGLTLPGMRSTIPFMADAMTIVSLTVLIFGGGSANAGEITRKADDDILEYLSNYACATIRSTGPRLADPVHGFQIHFELKLDEKYLKEHPDDPRFLFGKPFEREPVSLKVTRLSGKDEIYDRADQYTQDDLRSVGDKRSYEWFGTLKSDQNVTVKGHLYETSDRKWHYDEALTKNGKLALKVESSCIENSP